jgi:hypothetical protein
MKETETELWSRRRFMQVSAGAAIAASAAVHAEEQNSKPHRSMMDAAFEKREPRIGIIGTGGRATSLLRNILAADGKVVALCDIVRSKAEATGALVVEKGQKQPRTARRVNGSSMSIRCGRRKVRCQKERRSRRNGLHHDLPAIAVCPRGPAT